MWLTQNISRANGALTAGLGMVPRKIAVSVSVEGKQVQRRLVELQRQAAQHLRRDGVDDPNLNGIIVGNQGWKVEG